jgi:hypothetical protein
MNPEGTTQCPVRTSATTSTMAGIAKKHGMHAVAIGGIEDHEHALIDMGPTPRH